MQPNQSAAPAQISIFRTRFRLRELRISSSMATSTRVQGEAYFERQAQSASDAGIRLARMVQRGDEFAKNAVSLLCSTFRRGRRVEQNVKPTESEAPNHLMIVLLLCITFLLRFWAATAPAVASNPAIIGQWDLLVQNGGVSAMHMAVTHQDTLVYFDTTSGGASLMRMPDRSCSIVESSDGELTRDCWAHAAEHTLESRETRPLEVKTNPWCSSGSFSKNGTLIQTGGWNEGYKSVRYFSPCPRGQNCDWIEAPDALQEKRWYASNQILPDDRQVVVGGRGVPTYEFIPKRRDHEGTFRIGLLVDTNEEGAENNLYPFVYLNSDGNLFIFANRDSILLNLETNAVVRRYPRMPHKGSRNYPSSGSSVMLPLTYEDKFHKVEVMVCGGSPPNAYQEAKLGTFLKAMDTCGRMVITDRNPRWKMEIMPGPRVLSDMLILPTGEVLLINGCSQGTAGWELGRSPVLSPYMYTPNVSQWQVLANSTVPRMYHSTAVLIPDGRVVVAGSNPHQSYKLTNTQFPTELRMEAFSPPYMHPSQDNLRPVVVMGTGSYRGQRPITLHYEEELTVSFQLRGSATYARDGSRFEYRLNAPPFCTHAYSQNQRQLVLEANTTYAGYGNYQHAVIRAPPSAIVAPAGYYMLFVVHEGVPSTGIWVHLLPRE